MGLKDRFKLFFTKIANYVKSTKFFLLSVKERIRVLVSSLLITFYCLISFGILQFGIEEDINFLRVFAAATLVFIVVVNLFIFFIKFKIKSTYMKNQKHLFLKVFIILAIAMIAFYFAGETIGTSSDIQDQFNQAVSGKYNNWHPAAHTFLFYKVPIIIFGESLNSAVLFQLLFMAIILAYFVWSMLKFGIRMSVIAVGVALLLMNGTFRYIVKFPWKDIPFAFSILFLTVNLMWIYFSKGEWLKKKGNIFLLVLSLLLVIFLRHNGILAAVPTIIALLISYKGIRKRVLILSSATLAFFFVITGPIYGGLNIESHPESFAESMGVPNNQIAYIVKKEGNITEEESEFYSKVMPVGVIWYHYEIGDFNTVKWRKNNAGTAYYYNGRFLQNNKKEYLKTWFSIIKKNPELAFQGYYFATRALWESKIQITKNIDYTVGFAFFIATFFVAAAAFRDKRRLVPYIPMLFNMLGIMMLVTGGEIRFVFANLVCGMPLVLFALTPKNTLELPEKTVQ